MMSEEIEKLKTDINNVVVEIIDDVSDKSPAEKKKIKTNVIFIINLIIILISYMNCCKNNSTSEPEVKNISISKNI